MTRKRKSDTTPLDEADRTLYSTFCSAANSLSQLYTHAMNHQKVAFQAGERQALEKLYQWIIKQHEEGSRVTAADIVAHIENEINYGGDDAAISPRLHFQHQFPQSTPHLPNSSIQTSPGFVGQHSYVVPRTSHSEQLAQGEGTCGQGGTRSNYVNSSTDVQESNSPNPNDASMEIH
ncbi:hypothetical protein M5K25_022195 [Dendrobium thyrsiflorum]|uniref:Holocarboxylase synthetase n=1 Tax=Dendrobium thyrsiflorum TaxID=117978 RepID=A0ABD0U695_DENTH